MTPGHPLVRARRPPGSCRVVAPTLFVLLMCGMVPIARADPAATDTLSGPPGAGTVPPAAAVAASVVPGRTFGGALRADRVLHASFGLAIGAGVGLSSREPAIGAGTVIALAVAKELLDDRFDRGDLAAGAVGAGLAWLVVAALTR